MNDKKVSISLVTTCKGRLSYLKKTLPSWLKLDYDNYDIIVVDYDDPDGTEEYILRNKEEWLKNSKCKEIKVVKVKNKPYFNLNDARNRGIKVSDSVLIFMIDSDIIIKNKDILNKIHRLFKKGYVFFSSQFIMNNNYKEIAILYEEYYKVVIRKPVLLTVGTIVRGFNGTSCFLRKYFHEIGGFNTEINKFGYGQDENEFYLRYLNHYFYKHFYSSKKNLEEYLDKVLSKFYLLSIEDFHVIENDIKEKIRFYPKDLNITSEYNKKFIKNFVKSNSLNYKKDFFPTKNIIKERSLEFRKITGIKFPSWIKIHMYYTLSQHYIKIGNSGKSLKILRRLLKFKISNNNLKSKIYIMIGDILKDKGLKNYLLYYKKALKVLDKQEGTSKDYVDFLKARIFFKMEEKSKSKRLLKKVLLGSRNNEIRSSAFFLLYLISRKKEYLEESIKERIKKEVLTGDDILKIANGFFFLKKFNETMKWCNRLIKNKNISLDERIRCYFLMGDAYAAKKDGRKSLLFFKKGISIINSLKEKKVIDIYREGSLYKKIGEFGLSKKWFVCITKKDVSRKVKSGAYFHLGEIELWEGRKKRAVQYFEKCLKLNPAHQKAKQYLDELKG